MLATLFCPREMLSCGLQIFSHITWHGSSSILFFFPTNTRSNKRFYDPLYRIACQQKHPQLIGIQVKAKCLLTLLFGARPRKCLVWTNALRRNSRAGKAHGLSWIKKKKGTWPVLCSLNQATLIHLHRFIMIRNTALSCMLCICGKIRSIISRRIFTKKSTPLSIFWHRAKHSPLLSNLILIVAVFSGKKAWGLSQLLGK